jgi:hypothetical protein
MHWNASALRRAFLGYFQDKGHLLLPSDSLVPKDPSLLFTSAGMVQFKPYFLGAAQPPAPRVTTVQKCLRTTDIESVGDLSHLTFFEMLGNFSFGDYFKREAILFAWEFLTERLKVDTDRLQFTVFQDDDEAFTIWHREVGIPENRIWRLGEKTNFWPANAITEGPNGPCGPCSEIFYDTRIDTGCNNPDCGPACDCGRWLEIWNLVFMQYERSEENGKPKLTPLPKQNIDTGMGLERTAAVLMGLESPFETDVFEPIVRRIEQIAGVRYKQGEPTDTAIRLIADHIRAATFTIADGVIPQNEGRGYVLRRIIRRAILRGQRVLRIESAVFRRPCARRRRRAGRAVPRTRPTAGLHHDHPALRGATLPPHGAGGAGAAGGDADGRRDATDPHAGGRARVHPVRHLRLPCGVDAGNRRRARDCRRYAGLRAGDGGATPTRPRSERHLRETVRADGRGAFGTGAARPTHRVRRLRDNSPARRRWSDSCAGATSSPKRTRTRPSRLC